MGNKVYIVKCAESTIFNPNISLEDQLEYLGTQSFPYIEKVELYKLKNEQNKQATIFMKQHVNTASDDEGPLINLHEQLSQLKHTNLINYYGLCIDPNLMNNIQISKWYYESLFKTLKHITGYHYANKSLIPERELWKILHQLVSVLFYLESHSKWHTNLQLDSIYLDKNNQVKIIQKGVLRQLSGYQIVYTKKGLAFLSPQLIEQLHQKNIDPIHDLTKSDVYSIGMIFLELITLRDSFECYIFEDKNPQILYQIIEDRIYEAQQNGYSQMLLTLIQNMLIQDELYRYDFLEILNSQEMNQNLHDSKNVQPEIDNKPIKTEQTFSQISPVRIQSSVPPIQYLGNQQQQDTQEINRFKDEIQREQLTQQQLELQIRQQHQLLQQQNLQQQQQILLIQQQQQQIKILEQQLIQIRQNVPQQKIQVPKQQYINKSDYVINSLPIPPLTYKTDNKPIMDDFQESQDIKNRINSALNQSKKTIEKYGR